MLLFEQAEEDAVTGDYPASLAPGQIMGKDDGPNWFFVVRHTFPSSSTAQTQYLQP